MEAQIPLIRFFSGFVTTSYTEYTTNRQHIESCTTNSFPIISHS